MKQNIARSNFTQRTHNQFVALQGNRELSALHQLFCAFGHQQDQRKSVGNFIQAVFDRNPCHTNLRKIPGLTGRQPSINHFLETLESTLKIVIQDLGIKA